MLEFLSKRQVFVLMLIIAASAVSGYVVPTEAAKLIGTSQIADGAVTTPKLDTGAVTSGKISSSAVTTSKVANGAVTSAKITDGTIVSTDVSKSFVEMVHLADTNCGCSLQWDPDSEVRKFFVLSDDKVTDNSIIAINLPHSVGFGCYADGIHSGGFDVVCNSIPNNGQSLNYVVFNP